MLTSSLSSLPHVTCSGDYLVTIEEKNSTTYLRAYTNWRYQVRANKLKFLTYMSDINAYFIISLQGNSVVQSVVIFTHHTHLKYTHMHMQDL